MQIQPDAVPRVVNPLNAYGCYIYICQVDYLDIFSFHGINTAKQIDWVLRKGGCMEVIEEYRAQGKIRWIGFSTHAHADTIKAAIATNKFDSINIHQHVRAIRNWDAPTPSFERNYYSKYQFTHRAVTP